MQDERARCTPALSRLLTPLVSYCIAARSARPRLGRTVWGQRHRNWRSNVAPHRRAWHRCWFGCARAGPDTVVCSGAGPSWGAQATPDSLSAASAFTEDAAFHPGHLGVVHHGRLVIVDEVLGTSRRARGNASGRASQQGRPSARQHLASAPGCHRRSHAPPSTGQIHQAKVTCRVIFGPAESERMARQSEEPMRKSRFTEDQMVKILRRPTRRR